jgi:hypothetical protein
MAYSADFDHRMKRKNGEVLVWHPPILPKQRGGYIVFPYNATKEGLLETNPLPINRDLRGSSIAWDHSDDRGTRADS